MELDIYDGCIELVYVIPTELAEKIEKSDLSSMHEDFKDAKIVELWIEKYRKWRSIYNTKAHDEDKRSEMISRTERQLIQTAESSKMTMAFIGRGGQGKSTLVNSLLLIDPDSEETAEMGDDEDKVGCYTKCRNNTAMKIWDTVGLQDDGARNQEMVIRLLRTRARDDIDLFLYCVAYHPGIRHDDCNSNIIKF